MENPELLIGIPFLMIAGIGLFMAFSLFALPEEQAAEARGVRDIELHGRHPEPAEYVVIGLALAGLPITHGTPQPAHRLATCRASS